MFHHGEISPLRRNDRTAKLGSEPLDSCGVLRGIPHLGSLGSVLRARRFRVLGYQPPHTVEVESKPSGWQSAAGITRPCLRHLPPLGVLPFPGEGA